MMSADAQHDDPLLAAALTWAAAGYCVVPTHDDGGKRPFGPWKKYQTAAPSEDELRAWLAGGHYSGIGVLTGTVSGGVEMLEVEGRAVRTGAIDRLNEVAEATGLWPLWARVMRGCIEQSPNGGLHLFVRVNDSHPKPNTKLAQTIDPDTGELLVLAETRGQGGFVVVAPTPGRRGHPHGSGYLFLGQSRPADTVEVTGDERDQLHRLLATLDEHPDDEPAPAQPAAGATREGLSPGDDFNARAAWTDVLTPQGWVLVHRGTRNGHPNDEWLRPGKERGQGISATTGGAGDHLYVFSTSTTLPAEQPLTKFWVHAHYHHGGDLAAAARDLAAKGYGDPLPERDLRAWEPPGGPHGGGGRGRLPETFWAAHARLRAVHDAAHARATSAEAVLGAVLAHTCARIPPRWVLPPTVGGRVAVNTAVALVGPPGTGKGSAQRVARELVAAGDVAEVPLGSGEGLVQAYFDWRPDPGKKSGKVLERVRDACLVVDDEGSVLAALLARAGETAITTLLKAWMGERLGFTYSKRSQPQPETTVGELTYRWALLVGIQPDAAGTILDAAGVGLPQRMLWLPTVDPTIPEPGRRPAWPEVAPWSPPWEAAAAFASPGDTVDVDVAAEVVDALVADHHARVTGTAVGDALDAHAGLARLKVAALLHAWTTPGNHLAVTADDWDLAGQVMAVSDATRASVVGWLNRQAEERMEARARQTAKAQAAGDRITAAAKIVQRHVAKGHDDRDYCTPGCINRALGTRHRDHRQQAVDRAVAQEWIVDVSDDDTPRYVAGDSAPRTP